MHEIKEFLRSLALELPRIPFGHERIYDFGQITI